MLENSSRFASLGFNNILKHIQFTILPDWYLRYQSQKVKFHEANLVGVRLVQPFPKSTCEDSLTARLTAIIQYNSKSQASA